MSVFWQDIRYGLRILGKNPDFAVIAVLTLALGIGANTALFSVVHGVLIKPMPYENPEQLVDVYWTTPNDQKWPFSFPDFLDVQRQNHSFSSIAAYYYVICSLLGDGDAQRLEGQRVSADFFDMLNIRPLLGRTFLPEEDKLGAPAVVVIGDDLWRSRFNSSPKILGKSLNLSGESYTVIGVVPSHLPFLGPTVANVFLSINRYAEPVFRDRKVHMGTYASARLKPGVTLAQARADMDVVARDLVAAYPQIDKGSGINLVPIKEDTVGDVRNTLLLLMGAVGCVLLIACANVANLLLARGTSRSREFAVRRALGASGLRLVRQLLTESVLLALSGGLLGIVIAYASQRAVIAMLPALFPRIEDIHLDAPVLLFTLGAALLTGIFFGLAPALKADRDDISVVLKGAGRGLSGARNRFQSAFVVVELAASIILLTGAGLLVRSLAEMWKVNPGFESHYVLTFGLTFSPVKRSSVPMQRQALHDATANIESAPGIVAASGVGGGLPVGVGAQMPFWIDGLRKPSTQNEMNVGIWYAVQPDYLKTMGIPLLRGRFISPDDNESTPSIVVIDENFAREFFPNENPIGKQINTELMGPLRSEIVGVVGHVKQQGPSDTERQDREGQFYFAVGQMPDKVVAVFTGMTMVARTSATPLASVGSIRTASKRFDPDQVLFDFKPMDELLSESIANQRFTMILLSVFATLALMLSAIGVYGVISYLVSQRTREIGVRVALGAQRSDVLRLILGDGARLTLLGVAIGLAASLGFTRLLAKMLFGVRASDPLTLIVVSMILSAVAFLACYIPARRATRVDPMVALRYE
ncbi:MAG: ABC transporter permease [Candidatus Acidiferrales bacterium]